MLLFSIQSVKLYNNGSVLVGKGGVWVEDCVAYACYTQFVVVQACMNGENYTSPVFTAAQGFWEQITMDKHLTGASYSQTLTHTKRRQAEAEKVFIEVSSVCVCV